MLPSKGYFSAIPCVFYLAGNCERPHCHYRHCARDKKTHSSDDLDCPLEVAEERNWLGLNRSESLVTKMVEKAVDKAFDKVFVEDPKRAETLNREHIIKTALDKLKEDTLNSKVNPNHKSQSSNTRVPSYKPTPIAELNKRHIPVMYAPERPLSAVRKERGYDDKSQMNIALSSSINIAAEPFKQWRAMDGLKGLSSTVGSGPPVQDSAMEENRMDAKNNSPLDAFSELLRYQIEKNSLNYDASSELMESSTQMVSNQVDAVCDNVFSELGLNGLRTEQDRQKKVTRLFDENSHSNMNTFDCKVSDSCDSDSLNLIVAKEEENIKTQHDTKTDSPSDELDLVETRSINEQVIEAEKKPSHKHISKSHGHEKVESGNSSDKHKDKKSSSSKHGRRSSSSSKDKHRTGDKEKDGVHNHKTKSKSRSEIEKDGRLKVKKDEKGCDKHSKSEGKSNRREKHSDKPKDTTKGSHSSKSRSEESRIRSSSSNDSKRSRDHSKDIKSTHLNKTSSTSLKDDNASRTRKRKHEEESKHPEKRAKLSSKGAIGINSLTTDVDNAHSADSKKRKRSIDSTDAVNNDDIFDDLLDGISDDIFYDEESDDSIMSSPLKRDMDAISISSTESPAEREEEWHTVAPKKGRRQVLSAVNEHARASSVSRVSNSCWTKAKAIINNNTSNKMRIAHVPNVTSMLTAKTKLLSEAPSKAVVKPFSKTDENIEEGPKPKLTKRVAHGQNASWPKLITTQNVKMSQIGLRQKCCNTIYEAMCNFVSRDEAMKMAPLEELAIAEKSKLQKTYQNSCCLLLLNIRKNGIPNRALPVKILESQSIPDYTFGLTLMECFSKYLLTESDLLENGYPLPLAGHSGCAYTEKSARRYEIQQPNEPLTRKCVNCGALYEIDEDGMPTTSYDCRYHWGKLRRIPGRMITGEKFTCCNGGADAAPCQISQFHVWSGRNEDCMPGFVQTRKYPTDRPESAAGIFTLDCEMCYTTRGLELARLTVLNLDGNVVFDECVALRHPVLDYCTRFSGIDANKIESATHSFEDVQNWVLDHVYDKTILVGHSLENDLKALKILHNRIVDTSVLFPHRLGPPRKNSLKVLANFHLSLPIQEGEDGHDSKEDALACLLLMMKKIREDSKVRKPRVIIGFSGKKK